MPKQRKRTRSLAQFVDDLQSKGRLTFTSKEALSFLGVTRNALIKAADRLVEKRRLVHPVRGFYVIVPIEKRSSGAPDPLWFIDDLMKYQSQNYYVGVLSAASMHGASHQAAQELQVVTDSQMRPVEVGKIRIRFLTKKRANATPTIKVKTPFMQVPISSPEGTAIDLVKYVRWAGHLGNVATVLSELKEKLDSKKLVIAAKACGEVAVAQRLGYLLDLVGNSKLSKNLNDWVLTQKPGLAVLNPGVKSTGAKSNSKWKIIVNDKVESDL